MGASAERCPQCGEPVGRFDYQCPQCELVLEQGEAPGRARREVSVVRAMMERPRSAAATERPRKPRRTTTSISATGPNPTLPALDRVLQVRAALRLESLNLHPYDAWVVSLIDGQSTGQMLSDKLHLAPRELQGVLQALLERGVISLGPQRAAPPRGPRPDERAKTISLPSTDQPQAPTEIYDRAQLLRDQTDPHLQTPAPPPPAPAGRRATGPGQKPLQARSGSRPALGGDEDEDDESTVGMGRKGQPARRTLEAERPEPTVMLPRPDVLVAPAESETELGAPSEPTRIKKPAAAASAPRPPSRPAARATPEPMRPMTDPYRPPEPARPSRLVPRPTLGIDDVDAQGALQVALQMEQAGRMDEAVGYLERALARSPDAAPLYNRLAVILMRDFDDLARAEQLVLQALKLAPGHPVFTRNLNTIRQKLRDQKSRRR